MRSIYQTKRLVLLPMSHRFRKDLDILHADREVMQFIGGVCGKKLSHQKIDDAEKHWLKYGFGYWCFFLQNGTFIGRGGLRYQTLDNGVEIIEVAYMLHKAYWGYGYATEVARYALHLGFFHWNFKEITIITTLQNVASQKVVERLGGEFSQDKVFFRGEAHCIASFVP